MSVRFPNRRRGIAHAVGSAIALTSILMCGAYIATRLPQLSRVAESFALHPWWKTANWMRAIAISGMIGIIIGFVVSLQSVPADPSKRTRAFNYVRMGIYLAAFIGFLAWDANRRSWKPSLTIETANYVIQSSATEEQTEQIGRIAEALHFAYHNFVPDLKTPEAKLKMKLYRTREEFRFANRINGWAEAFYQRPYCHQYYAADDPNPFHWMTHEATHQLNAEVAGLHLHRWLDEGVACYFGASRIANEQVKLGLMDANAYPVWGLGEWDISGDLERDKNDNVMIPLKTIVSGKGGPSLDDRFNDYYLHWWSLAHFLFEFRKAQHRDATFALMSEGGSLEAFEKHIGPAGEVEKDWYIHIATLKTREIQLTQDLRIRKLRTHQTDDNDER